MIFRIFQLKERQEERKRRARDQKGEDPADWEKGDRKEGEETVLKA